MIETSNGAVLDVLYETGERLEAARPETADRGDLCSTHARRQVFDCGTSWSSRVGGRNAATLSRRILIRMRFAA
jgi:hypothetical protein